MKLYLVRHAEAVDVLPGKPDALRPLTSEGKRSFRAAAAQARESGMSPEAILTSPFARAVETSKILAEETGYQGQVTVADLLSPGFTRGMLDSMLEEWGTAESVALVGHEPDMGAALCSLLYSRPGRIPLKKGAIVALEWPGTGESPAAFLWMAAGGAITREAPAPPD